MPLDPALSNVQLKVQPRSGYDKAYMTIGSGKTGQLIPVFCDEILPNSKVNLRIAANASLPPLANDVYMRASIKMEAFFVPMRLLCGSFQSWFTGVPEDRDRVPGQLPYVYFDGLDEADSEHIKRNYFDNPSMLFDWLGLRVGRIGTDFVTIPDGFGLSMLPFLAYHKCYDDWYRASLIQQPVFVKPAIPTSYTEPQVRYIPHYFTYSGNAGFAITQPHDLDSSALNFNDGVNIFSLRQRNFGYDPYTIATNSPQLGDAQAVTVDNDKFTIAALRAANSMQQFEEFNQLAGSRYQDQLRVRYGASLSDGVAQRSLFLGSGEFEVYSKGVYQASADAAPNPRNPYNAVGSRYGSAYASGDEFIISGFHAQEPGYIMVLMSLVPRRTYATGVLPMLTKYANLAPKELMGNAVLQNVGNQPIRLQELGCMNSGVFGWQQRYAEYMYRADEVHGELRPGGKLQYFSLSEAMPSDDSFEISSSFLRIPVDYLDNIFAVAPQASDPRFWFDMYLDYKVSQPLARYSIPSLQNPAYEHGDTITIRRGGISL